MNTIAERLHFIMRKISSSIRSLLRPAVRSLPVPEAVSLLQKAFFCLWRRSSLPNIPEAQLLSGIEIHSSQQMQQAAASSARNVGAQSCAKAVTASATQMTCCMPTEKPPGFTASASKIPTPTAPAAPFQRHCRPPCFGRGFKTAIQKSKEYISQALAAMLDLGHGSGPLTMPLF